MANREFLMLAHTKASRHGIGGWWYSEKLDGMRCFWDGGITRGLLKAQVPFANQDKDKRYKMPPRATGLWSRYGNVIHAPDWWLDKLPKIPLDGELYGDAESITYRQDLMTIVKQIEPHSNWVHVEYRVFDSPPLDAIFEDGKINNTNFSKIFTGIRGWYADECEVKVWSAHYHAPFRSIYPKLDLPLPCRRVEQIELPMQTDKAEEILREQLDIITNRGGEGIMVRNPNLSYECKRSHHLLKIKKLSDMEGTVIGYISGRETDRGSKLLGMMGALVIRLDNGIVMELSGFTDAERALGPDQEARDWAELNPAKELPDWAEAMLFPRGSRVTFRYRGLTKDGVPQEARYWRKYED